MASATFFNLSVHTQRRIDKAYLKLCETLPGYGPAHKRRKLDDGPANSGGGFIIEDQHPAGGGGFIIEHEPSLGGGGFIVQDPPGGGGFIVDDESADTTNDVELDDSQLPRLPLDLIPKGLKLLDLPPDDAQALSVFEQAASGWDDDQPINTDEVQQKVVGLDDWRAVCGILLEPHDREYADSSDEESPRNRRNVQADEDSDDYEEHVSDEDYVDESFPRQRRRRTRQSAATGVPDEEEDEDEEDEEPQSNVGGARRLNKRQKEAALEDFANFFPDASSQELADKKIMISDIQRVAKLLKEKIKAEDVSKPRLRKFDAYRIHYRSWRCLKLSLVQRISRCH